jgi:hypothetical protein
MTTYPDEPKYQVSELCAQWRTAVIDGVRGMKTYVVGQVKWHSWGGKLSL